jgi:hypothetical protein
MNKMEKEKLNSKHGRVKSYLSSDNFKESNLYCKTDMTRGDKITNCDVINNRDAINNGPRFATKSFKRLYEGGQVFYQ